MNEATRTGATLELLAPLSGWVLPLAEVPDPVFAQGLAGDGVAIDPTSETLHAPCDGEVQLAGGNRHAVTLRTAAGDLLLHVGIDTVRMAGQGFTLRVAQGERVRAGQPLLDFDLAAVARGAASAITPVLLGGSGLAAIGDRTSGRAVQAGDVLMRIALTQPPATAAGAAAAPLAGTAAPAAQQRRYRVNFDHGLHARPAAQLAAALKGLEVEVRLRAHGREASVRSTVGIMALGVAAGDVVALSVAGRDAQAAWSVLDALMQPVADGEEGAVDAAAPAPKAVAPAPGTCLAGIVASRGLAEGVAVLLAQPSPVAPASQRPAQSPVAEQARLSAAIAKVDDHLASLAGRQDRQAQDVIAAHRALLADAGLREQAAQSISAGSSAAFAWSATLAAAGDALAALRDARMAERRADLQDIDRQVLRALAGEWLDEVATLPEHAIVIAQELLPSQLLALDPAKLAGVCTAAGGASSHVAIIAAGRGLPMIVGAGDALLGIASGTPLLLDAEAGEVIVAPPPAQRERHAGRRTRRAARLGADRESALQAAVTTDGHRIRVWCNLGKRAEAAPAVAAGAEGCGLLRTEFLFLDRRQAPTMAEQLAEYQGIADALAGRPLAIRTLDAGGDKPIAYLPQPHEDNPALGLRGLRTSLARPDLLAAQLEAIVAVQPAGQCRVLLPMVTDLADVRAVRAVLEPIAHAAGQPVPKLGVMIETPAAALLAGQLCREVEFLSIGSNDLSQYTLAMDRQHAALAVRLDGLHPAVLGLVARVADAARVSGRELGLCGGLASDPLAVPLLIGLGLDELSVTPAMIPTIKGQVRGLARAACEALAAEALEMVDAAAVRAHVRAWLGEE
jgi:multiphosphoryl transfer protein